MFPVVGFQIICSNYFQAVGKATQSIILSLSRQVLLFIPLLLVLPHIWGINGVWRTAPIADGLSVLLTATLIYFEIRNMGTIWGQSPVEFEGTPDLHQDSLDVKTW